MTRRIKRPEEGLQRAVAEYLDLVLPSDAFWFHVPNGGGRSKAEAGVLKAMGVKAGIPDICIIHRGLVHFIELKPKGRYFSASQKKTMPNLIKAGATVWPTEVRDIDQLGIILSAWRLMASRA